MLKTTTSNDKKKAMLAQKEQLLQEIKYYEKTIQEFPTNTPCFYYEGNSSSESEDDFPTLDIGPSIAELKQLDQLLRTCLQATQELTGVGVLQSEVTVMVNDPVIEGEKPVSEPGSWREVTAECRIDLVPFSVTFYTHQPSRKFAPKSFRGLRVLPVKTAQEAELKNSILLSLTKPSDVIEVLRSYAVAYRSRRSTLARLADKYANSLFMEPLAEGGFVLKCADLLELSWKLDNKLSAVAPFHHRMNFELEYMDESYLKIIKQAHHQLSDPSLQTDERTVLLAKIISTCLEAQGPTQELYESMESDLESVKKLEKTILDEDSDEESVMNTEQQTHKRKRDAEVMAPPKAIPKKTKPKGKENMDENHKSVKKSSHVDGAKKARIDDTNGENSVTDIVRDEKADVGTKNKKKIVTNQKNNEEEKELVEKDTEKTQKHSKNYKIDDKPNSSEVNSKLVNDNKTASKNTVKEKEAVSKGNIKNSDNDISTKKVAKNVKATKSQVKSTDIKKNTVLAKNVNNDIADNNEPNAKKVKESEKDGPQNSKIVKTAKNQADKKKTEVNVNKNAEAIQENIGTIVANTENYEKTTESSKAKAKTTKNINTKINDDNAKENVISDPATVKKSVNSNSANVKKSVNSEPANAKRSVNADPVNAKTSVNLDPANAKKTLNSDPANAKNNVNSNTANAKQSVNSDPSNAKKRVHSDMANTKTSFSPDNTKKSANSKPANAKGSVNADLANTKKNVHSDLANAKKNVNSNTANAKKSANEPKGTLIEKSTKISNVANKNKHNLAESNTKSDTEKIPLAINISVSVATSKKDNFVADNKKNHATTKNGAKISAPAKNQDNSKKILLKNHRNSSGKVPKKTIAKNLKPNFSKDGSRIPQKKLSPAYAAVLKQNPIRMSPRALPTLKNPSGSNIQSKLSKPVTNIPRLLKKPAPKSK